MELLALGSLAAVGVMTTMNKAPNTFDPTSSDAASVLAKKSARDVLDAGDVYHVQGRSLNAVEAGMNSFDTRYMPWSAPRQEPTKNWKDVVVSRAENTALVERDAPSYMFRQLDTLGISYGAPTKNSGYNILIPLEGVSMEGDPGYSLARLPKVFIDRFSYPELPEYTNWMFKGPGEPTETLRAELGNDADVMVRQRNPYGPFGYYQSILRNRADDETREKGNMKPDVLRAPPYAKQVRWGTLPQYGKNSY